MANGKPGRPERPDPDVVFSVKIRLFAGEDDDLIALYHKLIEGTRNGASVVKAALRGADLGVQLAEVQADIDETIDLFDDMVF